MFHMIVAFMVLLCYSVSVVAPLDDYCGKCSPISGVKCIDESTFAFCDRNGYATSRIASCPSGWKCINSIQICAKTDHGACRNKCKRCENGRFTCISKTAFSLCFGRNQTSKVAAKCALGKVCSTAKFDPSSRNPTLEFCFEEVLLEPHEIDCQKYEVPPNVPVFHPIGPARPPSEAVLPIASHPFPAVVETPVFEEQPASFCAKKKPGKYQILTDGKCQKYYVCYHNGVQMIGDIFTCAAHSVFDPTVQKCVRPTAGFYTLYNCGASRSETASSDKERSLVSPFRSVLPTSSIESTTPNDYIDLINPSTSLRSSIARGYLNQMNNPNIMHRTNEYTSPNIWNPFNYAHPLNPPHTMSLGPTVHQQGNVSPMTEHFNPIGLIPSPNQTPLLQQNPMVSPDILSNYWNQQVHMPRSSHVNPIRPYQTLWNWG